MKDKCGIACLLFLALIGVLFIGFIAYWVIWSFPIEINTVVNACSGNCEDKESLKIASELGRLDLITILLTVLTIFIAIISLFGFINIKQKSEMIAKEVTENFIVNFKEERAEKIIAEITATLTKQISNEMYEMEENSTIETEEQVDWGNKL